MALAVNELSKPFDLGHSLKTLKECRVASYEDFDFCDDDTSLSAAAIEEGLAVVAQLTVAERVPNISENDESTLRATLAQRASALMQGHLDDPSQLYVTAIRAFNESLALHASDHGDPLSAFAVVADLALNPRLPPMTPVDPGKVFSWDDVLPSRRFRRLLKALPQVGLPKRNLATCEPGEALAYRQRLMTVTGLKTWEIAEALPNLQQHLNASWKTMPRVNAVPMRFLIRAACKAIGLRQAVPYFFANPPDIWMRKSWAFVFTADTYDLAWRPPLISVEGRSIANGIHNQEFDEVVFSQSAIRTLLDCATTLGEPNYDGFPTDHRFSTLRDQIKPWLINRYNSHFSY
ncbi:MAG: hypothetical protein SGJ17_06485 [Hyphomicrobiales bacterium]|nr:hypothetical protein [Hyphomicrobiales bacterium]